MASTRSRYWTIMGRAWRLRCPRCGQGILFRGWFRMRSQCDWCGLVYEREPGFFLGSVYVNYGLTAVLTTVIYLSLLVAEVASADTLLWCMAGFCVVFPILFFRWARSLWLGFDQFWDPTEEEEKHEDADGAENETR